MAETVLNVVEMPQASVMEDGSEVQLVFKNAAKDAVRLKFAGDRFERFIVRAIQLFTDARNRRLAKGDHLVIHPVPVVAATFEPAVGGAKVILSLRAENGVVYDFSLENDEAQNLRPQLRKAIESAQKQKSQPRQ